LLARFPVCAATGNIEVENARNGTLGAKIKVEEDNIEMMENVGNTGVEESDTS